MAKVEYNIKVVADVNDEQHEAMIETLKMMAQDIIMAASMLNGRGVVVPSITWVDAMFNYGEVHLSGEDYSELDTKPVVGSLPPDTFGSDEDDDDDIA